MGEMKTRSLEDRLHHELKELYGAERQLAKALPLVAEAASDRTLKNALAEALETSKHNGERLTRLRKDLGITLAGQTCDTTVQGLEEARRLIRAEPRSPERDMGLVVAVQRMECQRITRYTEARMLADSLGLDHAARLLSEAITGIQATMENLFETANCLFEVPPSISASSFRSPTSLFTLFH
jgi:ferritin-like metal-binding protein YciE